MSASEQQAVDSAQSYLSMSSGFSQYSLTQQLTSSAGSGFSQADAQFGGERDSSYRGYWGPVGERLRQPLPDAEQPSVAGYR